jgi:hypothetical protein
MMSLSTLKKNELTKLAKAADVPLEGNETNKQIIAKLEENNVSFEFYVKSVLKQDDNDDEGEAEQLFQSSDVLLKMERKNPSFQAFGHTFTQEHPYAIVSEETAQQIIDSFEGFRLASPSEAKSFYS